jgi:glucose-1-phosphate adenylyltransferase
MDEDVIAVVLGGGRGTRLAPLTQYRSKPAVPIAGSYRLVDVAVSNCIHADLRRIFVVTQYESESLHRHIANTYAFDAFSSGFVDILAAEQTETEGDSDWFRGTADAVRRTMKHYARHRWSAMAILSGDQLYRMSLREMLRVHRENKAAATVATTPVPAEQTSGFGIMKVDPTGRIVHFDEKPPATRLAGLASTVPGVAGPAYLASMGIYVFDRAALEAALRDPDAVDFGKQVIPAMLARARVQAYRYDGYWEDVGTIRSNFEANHSLTAGEPPFSFYHPRCPIYSQRPFLAPTKLHACRVDDALIADGCFLESATIERSVIGVRTRIGAGAVVRRAVILGADYYDHDEGDGGGGAPRSGGGAGARVPLGIGAGTVIENAIVDKNARIGRNVRIVNARGLRESELPGGRRPVVVREGIVIVPKGAVIPDGTEI